MTAYGRQNPGFAANGRENTNMKKEKKIKTNAMRMLDEACMEYELLTYEADESDLSAVHAARTLGLDPAEVFKTLVVRGDRTGFVVACIPAAASLDLKALARESGNKSAAMIHVKELPEITGYIRGGCSPIGMKKRFPVFVDSSAAGKDRIAVSAGRRGAQLLLSPSVLLAATGGKFACLVSNDPCTGELTEM